MKLNGKERAVALGYLLSIPWAAPLEDLEVLADAVECLEGASLLERCTGQLQIPPALLSDEEREFFVPWPAADLLLERLPTAPTPGVLGPAKVALLRKLKAAKEDAQ